MKFDEVIEAARAAAASRVIDRMVAQGMIEKVGGGGLRPVNPRFWKPQPWDKGFKARRKKAQMLWEQLSEPEREIPAELEADMAAWGDGSRACLEQWSIEALEGATLRDLNNPAYIEAVAAKVLERGLAVAWECHVRRWGLVNEMASQERRRELEASALSRIAPGTRGGRLRWEKD
jgi:hypothetical protein